ncbi:metallophosphoesterase [Pendulispora rubella]|uniref:Metallophosphoesterase n=1 Tax=Pendulispora rubella TaxID=2741070 RepID=A0ABZ2LIN6_9BACT
MSERLSAGGWGTWERAGLGLLAAAVCSASAISACGGEDHSANNAGGEGAASPGVYEPPSEGPEPAADTNEAADEAPSVAAADIPTDANFKVAFIGDTASGEDFRTVLQLVKREAAQLVVVQGDLTYDGEAPPEWFSAIDAEINTAQTKIPYFVSKGNHDSGWSQIGSGLKSRMATWNIPSENNDPTKKNYSVVYKGLKIVMVSDSETSPSRATYVKDRLANDAHIWKICSWHKNQRATNVGPKSDEMGWTIYENCRAQGAIVAQGHSHTYSRSKTVTNDQSQTIDSSCNSAFDLCVAPGKHFFFDSSLGGHDMRPLNTTVASKPYWGSTYASSFGALFITFHVDGDPRKARGYFKTVDNVIIDPPASSGKTSFTITRAP